MGYGKYIDLCVKETHIQFKHWFQKLNINEKILSINENASILEKYYSICIQN